MPFVRRLKPTGYGRLQHVHRLLVLIDPEEGPGIGWARTREEAQQQFAVAWRSWLSRSSKEL
jgi:hypothetical protein